MISKNFIKEWRQYAPWILDSYVEQDLVISRALIELFSSELISNELAFRGGTALHKLYSVLPSRYSEDIDFVQMKASPIGPVLTEIRAILHPWLGASTWKLGDGRATCFFRFQSEGSPSVPMKLKVEINTREHFSTQGFIKKDFSINSTWFKGKASITTYHLEELMGTKLRALYQRKKGRDLFDFWHVLRNNQIDVSKVIDIFYQYMDKQEVKVSRAQFEKNLAEKMAMRDFVEDIRPLLSPEIADLWSLEEAFTVIEKHILPSLRGEPWKGKK